MRRKKKDVKKERKRQKRRRKEESEHKSENRLTSSTSKGAMRRKKKDTKKERRRQKRRRKKRKVSIKVKDINKKDCKISNNENEKGKRAYREKICFCVPSLGTISQI